MPFVISFFVAELIFFAAFIIFSGFNYKKRFETKYNPKNMFPYEINYESRFSENMIGNICFVLFLTLHLGVFVLQMNYFLNERLVFNLVTSILYVVTSALVFFVPLRLLKTHLICSTLLIGASFLNFASLGYTAFDFYNLFNKEAPFIVLTIIGFVVAIFYFGVVMNPKLTSWAKVDKVEQNGKTIYQRPKIFVLAFSEWLSIYGLPVASLLGTLTYIFISK